jgi:hypothetical protein
MRRSLQKVLCFVSIRVAIPFGALFFQHPKTEHSFNSLTWILRDFLWIHVTKNLAKYGLNGEIVMPILRFFSPMTPIFLRLRQAKPIVSDAGFRLIFCSYYMKRDCSEICL